MVEIVDRCVPLKKAGKDFKACCPFHDEKTPSFTVSPSKQFYHCFGCGASGTAITFVMEFNHLGFREAVEDLANAVGLSIPDTGLEHQDNDTPRLLEHLEEAKQFYKRQLRSAPGAEAAIAYLKKRGISGEVAAEFERPVLLFSGGKDSIVMLAVAAKAFAATARDYSCPWWG